MLLPHTKHSLRTFRVKRDGSVIEGDPLVLLNTLHSHAFPDGEASLLRLEVPDETGFDVMSQRLTLVSGIPLPEALLRAPVRRA